MEARGDGRFAFGYEEALGYSVGRTVRDKDGISAAIVMADLAAGEAAAGRSVLARLHDLWDEVGLWVSAQHSIVSAGPEGQQALLDAVDRLAKEPPTQLLSLEVTGLTDYRVGGEERPSWLGAQDLVELTLSDVGRLLVRPSGTEPKLKIYVDLSGVTEPDHGTAHRTLTDQATEIASAMGEWLAI
jgi:phosphomannomutase